MPQSLHRRLKARAAIEGLSMSQFVIREIERALRRPTRTEVLEAIEQEGKIELSEPPAEVIRSARRSR